MTDGARAVRIQLLIGFMCVALVVYFVMLGRIAMAFITSGRPAAIGLGLALMILPLIGIWAMVSTLRAGLAHQRLARIVTPPMRCSKLSATNSKATRTTGGGGTGWPAPMTTPATAAAPARP